MLWATQVGFKADALVLAAGAGSTLPHTWTLASALPIRVRVLDGKGSPIPGAEIDQFGLVDASTPRDRTPERLERLLHRSILSDGRGEAVLGSFPGEQVLVASAAGQRSVHRRVGVGANVELRLSPTFSVEGTVSLPSWAHLDYTGERRLSIAAQKGNQFHTLASSRNVEAGSWGPIELPLVPDADRYRIRLEGSPIIPVQRMFDPPAEGSRLRFDLAAELGCDAWFQAENEARETLFDSRARVWWRQKEFPNEWTYVERRARPEDGRIAVWSVPAGGIKFEIHASGYVPYFGGGIELPMKEPFTALVTLQRAGRIRGSCLYEGKPLEDFEVAVWGQVEAYRSLHSFVDREDGSFEIDEAPMGEARITASTAELPSCPPQRVRVAPDETAEVVLELSAPLIGRGRVIDARTQEPVPDALIQLHIRGAVGAIGDWGLPHPVQADGTFEIAGFVEGANPITIQAPGHAALSVTVKFPAAEDASDLGTFALERPQPLEVRLIGSGPLSGFQLRAQGPESLPQTSFPDDGVLHFERVGPGYLTFTLTHPDQSEATFAVNMVPGTPWIVEKLANGGRRLLVEPLAESKEELEKVGFVHVVFRSDRGYVVQWMRSPVSTEPPLFDFDAIDSASVQATLFDHDLQRLAVAHGAFGSQSTLHLQVPLGQKPLRVRVVDPDGKPIPDVLVTITDPANLSVVLQEKTGADGECEILGVPRKTVQASLFHQTRGSRHQVPFDASAAEVELLLASNARIELLLLDGDEPAAGISCALLVTRETVAASSSTTGPDGALSVRNLTPGTYPIRCSHPDYWTVDAEVEAREDPTPTAVQIRRLGAIVLLVTTAAGIPVNDLQMELRSTEFGVSVEDWIAAERITAGAGLRTDDRGELALEGLPHGPYTWAIDLPDGRRLEGTLTVLPRQHIRIPLVLP